MCVVLGLLLHKHLPDSAFGHLLRHYGYDVEHHDGLTLVVIDTLDNSCLCNAQERLLADIKNVVDHVGPNESFSYFPNDWGNVKTMMSKAIVRQCSSIDEAFEKYPPLMSTGSFRVEILNKSPIK